VRRQVEILKVGAVAFADGRLSRKRLPTTDRKIDKQRINLNGKTDAETGLRRDQGRTASQERLVYRLARAGIIQHRPAHTFHRLLSCVLCLGVLAAAWNSPQSGLLPVSGPIALLPDGVPAGLMLPVIVPLAHDQPLLGPNDLGSDRKATLK
jgi:hypothetical protein